jgi:hypothetical protein
MRVRRNVPLLFGPVNQPLLLFEGRADSLGNSYRPCRHAPSRDRGDALQSHLATFVRREFTFSGLVHCGHCGCAS